MLLSVLACFLGGGGAPAQESSRCEHPVPAGVRVLPSNPEFDVWGERHVFASGPGEMIELPSLRKGGDVLEFHLDRRQKGTLRVEPVNAEREEFAAIVNGADGSQIARATFVAPYRTFELVPADLVAGDGDELILITAAGHSSPPIGSELMIWQLVKDRMAELVQPNFLVSERARTYPQISCAWLRRELLVNRSSPKPRAIQVHGKAWYQAPCCLAEDADVQKFRIALRGQALRYANGKYTLR